MTMGSERLPRVVVLGSFVHAHWWSVPRLPGAGESCLAHAVHSELGGKGLNVAVGIQRLGVEVDLVLGVGRDAAAQALAELLAREGIAQQYVFPVAEHSGRGAGLVDAAGENSIAVFPGANMDIGAPQIAQAAQAIGSASLVYGQLEMAADAVLAAFTVARAQGVRTVLNASPAAAVSPALLAVADVLVVNAVEAAQLLGLGAQDELHAGAAAFMARWPGQALVVTVGGEGSLLWVRGQPRYGQPAASARPGGDSAGAGDGFAAGLCAALAQGQGWPQALQLASQCGAAVASGKGVLAHLPRGSAWKTLRPAT
jgi:ribokinase